MFADYAGLSLLTVLLVLQEINCKRVTRKQETESSVIQCSKPICKRRIITNLQYSTSLYMSTQKCPTMFNGLGKGYRAAVVHCRQPNPMNSHTAIQHLSFNNSVI